MYQQTISLNKEQTISSELW